MLQLLLFLPFYTSYHSLNELDHGTHPMLYHLHLPCAPTDGQNKLLLLKIIGVSALGVVTAVSVFRRRQQGMIERKPAPRLGLTKSGRFDRLENFSSYVGKLNMGFSDCNFDD